jgi:hypothetical protein
MLRHRQCLRKDRRGWKLNSDNNRAREFHSDLYGRCPKDLPFFIALMEHLAQHVSPARRPSRARRRCSASLRAAAAIVTFLTGMWRGASAIACGRRPGTRRAHRPAPRSHDPAERPLGDSWQRLFTPVGPAPSGSPVSAKNSLPCSPRSKARGPAGCRAVIHADLFPDNVFPRPRAIGLIDFYLPAPTFSPTMICDLSQRLV